MDPRALFDDVVPFVTVAEARSFRAAAQRLGLSAAAVSKAVQRLEERLGVRLLHRTTRSVELSAEGEVFLDRCREAVRQLQAGQRELELVQEAPRGELTVSMPTILEGFVTGRLASFIQAHPSLRLRLRLTDRHARMIDDQVDVAVRIGELADSTLLARLLMRTRWATVASPGYLERHGVPRHPAALMEHRCLKFFTTGGQTLDWTFLAPGATTPFIQRVPDSFDADQGQVLTSAAMAGAGLCQAFDFMVRESLVAGALVEVLSEFAAPGPPIHALCLPGQQDNPRVRAFIDFLLGVFRASASASPELGA